MPIDETGNEYIDLISPATPAVPLDLNKPIDIPATVNALVKAPPEQQRAFLRGARQRMDPETYNTAVSAMYKAGRAAQAESGPAGIPHPGPAFRTYPDPTRTDNEREYQAVLDASGRGGRHD